jgi:hypothetical protein
VAVAKNPSASLLLLIEGAFLAVKIQDGLVYYRNKEFFFRQLGFLF